MHRISLGWRITRTVLSVVMFVVLSGTSSAAADDFPGAQVIFSARDSIRQSVQSSGSRSHSVPRTGSRTSDHEGLFRDSASLPPDTATTKIATLAILSLADYFQTTNFLYAQKNIIGMNYYYHVNTGRNNTEIYQLSSAQFHSVPQKYKAHAIKSPVYEISSEENPMLGPQPRREQLLAFGVAGLGLTVLLSATLPEPWAEIVLNSVLASEAGNVLRNASLMNQKGGWDRVAAIPIMMSFRF